MNIHKVPATLLISCLSAGSPGHATEADRVAPSTLRFLPDGSIKTDGVVLSGQTLHIEYDPIRLAACRGKNPSGVEEWTVQAFLAIDGQAPLVIDLIEGRGTLFPYAVPGRVLIPDGRRLDIWFKASDVTGCVQWDSNHNQNYSYTIHHIDEIPLLTFNANWQIEQTGELKIGAPVRLHYDLERATSCRTGGYHGSASWDVTPQLRVDGVPVPTQTITYARSWSQRGQQDVVVLLPYGQELTLWFENSGYEYYAGRACMAYDSNFGKNYHFTLN
jgi:hypothetical protein